MSFLENLRMSNIFPKKPATDRPFGMPEIDDGNIKSMLSQVMPAAEQMNQNDARRQRDMMQFEFDLKNKPRGQTSMPIKTIHDYPPTHANVVQAPQTPMQKMFSARSEDARGRENQVADMSTKFSQALEMQKQGGVQDIDLQNLRGEQATSQIEQRGGIDRDVAGIRAKHDMELNSARNAQERAAIMLRHQGEMLQEGERGRQNRMTQSEKPITGAAATAKDQTEAFAGRVQQLAIDAPNLAKLITLDAESGGQFRISQYATPEQQAAIRNYMTGQRPQAAPTRKAPDQAKRKGTQGLRK